MVDQIADLLESITPGARGPEGPEGPRGLPGVNAVENDEAVAAYIGASDSHTRAALDEWSGANRTTAVFLGDSITAGLGVAETERWPRLLCDKMGWREANYAVSGDTVQEFAAQASKALAGEDAARVGHVFVCGGVNNQPADDPAESLAETISRLHAAWPHAPIIMGVGPMGYNLSLGAGSSQTWRNRRALYARLRRAALDTGLCAVVDMSEWYLRDQSLLQGDHMHPNKDGHRLIAGMMRSTLQGSTPPAPYLPMQYELGPTYTPDGAKFADDASISLLVDDDGAWLHCRIRFTVSDIETYGKQFDKPLAHLPGFMSDNDTEPAGSRWSDNWYPLLVSVSGGGYEGICPPWAKAWLHIHGDGGMFMVDRWDTDDRMGWPGLDLDGGIIEYQATIPLPRYGLCIPAPDTEATAAAASMTIREDTMANQISIGGGLASRA